MRVWKVEAELEREGEESCADLEYRLKQLEVQRGLNHVIIYYSNGDRWVVGQTERTTEPTEPNHSGTRVKSRSRTSPSTPCPATWASAPSCPTAGGRWSTGMTSGTGASGWGEPGRAVVRWSPLAAWRPPSQDTGCRTNRLAGGRSITPMVPPSRETGSGWTYLQLTSRPFQFATKQIKILVFPL